MVEQAQAELITVSKIRFGDPITALAIGRSSILHGSIMGRIVHYSLESKIEKEIIDMSNEMVREITISSDGAHYYVANGDTGWHVLAENGLSPIRTFSVEVKGNHIDVCERSYTFQAKGYNCVVILSSEDEESHNYNYLQGEDKIVLTNLETQIISRVKNDASDFLPHDSIPFDFDGDRLMYFLGII